MSELTHEPFDTRENRAVADLVDYIPPAALREMLNEAQAQAAAWEEIALALAATGQPYAVEWIGGEYHVREGGRKTVGKGPTISAALLAWHAAQKQ